MKMKKLAVMALATALSVGSVMTASAAWLQEGSNWRYQNDNGTFQTGTWFRDADGRWYHFDNNGIMQKGWFQDTDGKWYFLSYNGVMQVGLIKVDNQVYYMGTSGDLFIGEMKIGNTTYNFGLYGTTNGKPSVPVTATFGGNGNQSLNSGGGSSSNGGGGSTTTPVDDAKKAVGEVANVADSIKESSGGVVEASVGTAEPVGTDALKVDVKVKAAKDLNLAEDSKDKETVVAAVVNVVSTVVSGAEGSAKVEIEGVKLPTNSYPVELLTDTKIKELAEKYVTSDNYKTASKATVTVTVNGVDVTYNITLSK